MPGTPQRRQPSTTVSIWAWLKSAKRCGDTVTTQDIADVLPEHIGVASGDPAARRRKLASVTLQELKDEGKVAYLGASVWRVLGELPDDADA